MPSAHPQAVNDRAKRLCAQYGPCTAAEIMGISRTAIWRMSKRDWREGRPGRHRPRPSDFAIQCGHMTHAELRAHYGAASGTITRWRRELRA